MSCGTKGGPSVGSSPDFPTPPLPVVTSVPNAHRLPEDERWTGHQALGTLGQHTGRPTGDPAWARRQLPHHVELVQAQSVYARPLAIHGLPEGLKEQVLWGGKRPGVTEGRRGRWGCEAKARQEPRQGITSSQTLGFSVVRQRHDSGLEMGLRRTLGRKAELTSNPERSPSSEEQVQTAKPPAREAAGCSGHFFARPPGPPWLG